jgi:hypothetical protein
VRGILFGHAGPLDNPAASAAAPQRGLGTHPDAVVPRWERFLTDLTAHD